MLIYQGVDIVEIPKLRRIIQRNSGFVPSVFSATEQEYCLSYKNSYQHFAGRFAAKEACLKALGLGLSVTGTDTGLLEIEIVNHPSGRPELHLTGWVSKLSASKGISQQTVSISHTRDYAVASVVMLGTVAAPPAQLPHVLL